MIYVLLQWLVEGEIYENDLLIGCPRQETKFQINVVSVFNAFIRILFSYFSSRDDENSAVKIKGVWGSEHGERAEETTDRSRSDSRVVNSTIGFPNS